MVYKKDERETIIQTDDISNSWTIYTRQLKYKHKLDKQGYTPVKVEKYGDLEIAWEYIIPLTKLTFRNSHTKKKEYSEEEKEVLRQRLAAIREKK